MEKKSVSLLDLGSKARSKAELYRMLIAEEQLYLPPYKLCPIDFIADLIDEKKKALETNEVIIRSVPQVDGLRTNDILTFLLEECSGEEYLPYKWRKMLLNRDWLCNLCNSLNTNGFNSFVNNRLKFRLEKLIKENSLSIMAPQKFTDLFENSLMVSTCKGRSHQMLNRSKRFDRENFEDYRASRNEEMKQEIERLKEEVENLNDQLVVSKLRQEEAEANIKILERLFVGDVIDKDGNLLNK